MAKYKNSAWGAITGSLGDQVGTSWLGRKVLRTKGYPSTVATAAQIVQRDVFKAIQYASSQILTTVIQPFWDHLVSGLPAISKFMSVNIKAAGDLAIPAKLLVTFGSYEPVGPISRCDYDAVSGIVTTDYDDTVKNIGDVDDRIIAVCLDRFGMDETPPTGQIMASVDITKKRSDGSVAFTIPTGRTATNIQVYLGLVTPAGAIKMQTANSINEACVSV